MRLFDAEPRIIRDLAEESQIVASKEHPNFQVTVGRLTTLGKVVIVEGTSGDGIIVEVEA